MAVNGKGVRWRAVLLGCSIAVLGVTPAGARDQAARDPSVTVSVDAHVDAQEGELGRAQPAGVLRAGPGRMQRLLRDAMERTRKSSPDWLRYRSGTRLRVDAPMAAGRGDLCLVLQEGRADGTDLLTARFTLLERGRVRTFAGAGLNRAVYFYDDPDEPGPSRLDRHHRDSALGAAAELGAEMQVSGRMHLSAEVRWADLHDRALVLRSERGPVAAESVMLGVAVGYRFR